MSSIDILKPLWTVVSSVINKCQQHQEKNSWDCQESHLGPLGEKRECLLCALQPSFRPTFNSLNSTIGSYRKFKFWGFMASCTFKGTIGQLRPRWNHLSSVNSLSWATLCNQKSKAKNCLPDFQCNRRNNKKNSQCCFQWMQSNSSNVKNLDPISRLRVLESAIACRQDWSKEPVLGTSF